jgi:putative tryptophan/tyrosine transport system substrate-binding protein
VWTDSKKLFAGGRQMRRREFLVLLGGVAIASPLDVRAQQTGGMRRVGVLMNGAATQTGLQLQVSAFLQGLKKLGWSEGRNIHVDIRWNAGDAALARIYAAQLIGLMPDVIVASSTTNLIAIREATSTVPVVFMSVSDPVAQGFVASMTKPGGNITGFTAYEFSIGSKWLELLKQISPAIARVAVMFNPDTSPQSKFFLRSVETAAASLDVRATPMPVRSSTDIEPAIARFASEANGSLILPTDAFLALRYELIADAANRYRLPSMSTNEGLVKSGGLITYNISDLAGQWQQMASYVDRILKGEKPADLPIQAPTKYQLVINLKTAKALGLTVPLPLLGRADEVIE